MRTIIGHWALIDNFRDISDYLDQDGSDISGSLGQDDSDISDSLDQDGSDISGSLDQDGSDISDSVDEDGRDISATPDHDISEISDYVDQDGSDSSGSVDQDGSHITMSMHPFTPTSYTYCTTSKTKLPCFEICRKVSNIRRTFVGNYIFDHSDAVGAPPIGAAPTTSSFSI